MPGKHFPACKVIKKLIKLISQNSAPGLTGSLVEAAPPGPPPQPTAWLLGLPGTGPFGPLTLGGLQLPTHHPPHLALEQLRFSC